MAKSSSYRGRLAPSPTGYLHLGHARTFWIAWQRARATNGKLVFRNEDLDYQRCKPEFVRAMYEDLRWLGLDWDEGFDLESGVSRGNFGPYSQSERRSFYLDAWRKLRDSGLIYPCTCSRKDLERALSAPHEEPHSCGTAAPGGGFFDQGASEKAVNDCGAQAPSLRFGKTMLGSRGRLRSNFPPKDLHRNLRQPQSNPQPTTNSLIPEPAAKKSQPQNTTIHPQA